MTKHRKAYMFLLATAFFWAGNAVAGKLAIGHISPFLLTLIRWLVAALVVWILGYHQLKADWPRLKRQLPLVVLCGAFGFAGFNLLFYSALHHTSAINVAIEQGGIPVIILLANFMLFGVRSTMAQIAGVALSLTGIAVTATHGDLFQLIDLNINFGDLIMIAAIVLYGGYAVALRFKPDVDWRSLMIVMSLAAAAASMPFAALEAMLGDAIFPDATGWLIVGYTAIFASVLAQTFFIRGVELIGGNRAGLFVNLVPVLGTMLSVLIVGETLRLYHIAALTLVIGGIMLAENSGRKQQMN